MSFTDAQIGFLKAPLNGAKVRTRKQAGRELSYIEGWWAISEANRIFGFDRWHRETVEMQRLADPREVDGKWRVAYMGKVRIVVEIGGGSVIREGTGYGSGIDRDIGSAHESAIKEAETDAMKRALMTFGNPFGLALYDKEQNGVEHEPASAPAPQQPHDEDIEQGVRNWTSLRRAEIDEASRIPDLYQWKDEHEYNLNRLRRKHPSAYQGLMQYYQAKFENLSKKETVSV